MDNKTGSTKTYDLDKVDDLIRELDDSKIRINALIDYNLKLKRVDAEQVNKNLLSHEFERLSPIMELLNTEVFESLTKAMDILGSKSDNVKTTKKTVKE